VERIEQMNKYKLHRTEKMKMWKPLYLLELLVMKEDSGRVDKEKGN
jgi:hypothetical protein